MKLKTEVQPASRVETGAGFPALDWPRLRESAIPSLNCDSSMKGHVDENP
jgi:hypothetical protein